MEIQLKERKSTVQDVEMEFLWQNTKIETLVESVVLQNLPIKSNDPRVILNIT